MVSLLGIQLVLVLDIFVLGIWKDTTNCNARNLIVKAIAYGEFVSPNWFQLLATYYFLTCKADIYVYV